MTSGSRQKSAPEYDVEFHRDVRIPTADPDVTLGADLYLPTAAGPVPLLVMVLPYRKDLGGANLLLRYFAQHGYAGLMVDLLGTGSSDGIPRPAFTAGDADDAIAAITWGAEQEWCDGNVGMWGHSFGGYVTMRTAARRPAALKAIIPMQGFADPEVAFVHPDHARGCLGVGTWASGMLGMLLLPPVHEPDDDEATDRWRRRLDTVEPYLLDMFRHAAGDPEWRRRAFDPAAIDVPALCWLGWRDLFCDPQARAFEAMTGPKRLVAGPWMHLLPIVSEEAPLDFLGMCLDWWDRWLKGIDNGADTEPSVAFVQGPAAYWARLESWPRAAARDDVRFTQTSSAEKSDPTVGALSGLTRGPYAGFGLPDDQQADDLASTCWTSQPLARPLLVVGRPQVTLEAPVSSRLVVKLTHVEPSGRSIFITSGAVGEGTLTDGRREVELDATAYEIPAGHSVRIVVSDADFPRLWPLPSDGPPRASLDSARFPTLTPSDSGNVVLPEQPAHLAALLASLQAGEGPSWTLQRDRTNGALTAAVDNPPARAVLSTGLEMETSDRVSVVVSPSAEAELSTSSDRAVQWPDRPLITVHAETQVTAGRAVGLGRVTSGDEVLFEKIWSVTLDEN